MAIQINGYLAKHELAFEGRYSGGVLLAVNSNDYYKYRQNDNVSHFICRLAYCRNEELRKWFLS